MVALVLTSANDAGSNDLTADGLNWAEMAAAAANVTSGDLEEDEAANFYGQPCPGSNGATLEQMEISLQVEFVFGLILSTGKQTT